MKKFQIVVDSSSDLENGCYDHEGIDLKVVPLTINIDKTEYTDNKDIDLRGMIDHVKSFKGKTSSSCPPVGKFEEVFEEAEHTICVTLSANISGTYNSARLAAEAVGDNGKKVHVVDSGNTTGCIVMIAEKAIELIKAEVPFEEMTKQLDDYAKSLNLLFILRDFTNLVNNGRMSKVTGKIAGLLKITPIATTVDGEITLVEKKRTPVAAMKRLVEMIGERITDPEKRNVIISHCFDLETANYMKELICEKYKFAKIRIIQMRGLASYYALEKGIIVSF